MRIVTISGPRGAGKETVLNGVLAALNGNLRRIIPCTTRMPRNGEKEGREYHFITRERFDRLLAVGEFAYSGPVQDYWSGTLWRALLQPKGGIIDITTQGARLLEKIVSKRSGSVFSVYLYAGFAERASRIERRQPNLLRQQIVEMLENDPVSGDPRLHQDFSLLVRNGDEELDSTIALVVEEVSRFLNNVSFGAHLI